MSAPRSLHPVRALVAASLLALFVVACSSSTDTTGAGAGAGPGGVACAVDRASLCAKETSGYFLKCDAALGCVTCLGDADCGGANPFCILGLCEGCRSNADCPAAEPVCDTARGYNCHGACKGDGDCVDPELPGSPEAPGSRVAPIALRCGTDGRCSECRSDADCKGLFPRCDPSGMCGSCLTDADCSDRPEAPHCDRSHQKTSCAECLVDAHCPAAKPKCSPFMHTCGS